MAETLFQIRHDTAGLSIITDRGVSRATVIVGNGRLALAVSQAGLAFADLPLEPEDARHLAGALMLGAAEAESEAVARAETFHPEERTCP